MNRLISSMVTELIRHVNYFTGICQKPIKLGAPVGVNSLLTIEKVITQKLTLPFIVNSCLKHIGHMQGLPQCILPCHLHNQGSYRQVCAKFKDFSRIFKTFLLFSRTENSMFSRTENL